MDRGRHRAILSVVLVGSLLGGWWSAGSFGAQGSPTTAPAPTASPSAATPWVQASPPPTPTPTPTPSLSPSPTAPPAPPAKAVNVTVHVDRDGHYFLDKDKTALPADALTGRLRQLHETHGDDLRVLIRADQDANYAAITTAIDRAREAGIKSVAFSLPPRNKAGTPTPPAPASPTASPTKIEVAVEMARRREEELARQQRQQPSQSPPTSPSTPTPTPTPGKPPLSPDDREAYERNLGLWLSMPPEERQAIRSEANERIREETEKAYASTGLNLNEDQREVFALRYRQERRRLERELQDRAKAERARRIPEILDRIKREFPTPTPSANTPKPTPKPTATPAPSASPTPAPSAAPASTPK